MNAEVRRGLGELLAYLEWLVQAHRAAGRMDAAAECERFAALVKGLQ